MAELYFKVKSDWEEVVKLRTEIMRLDNQLNDFNGNAPLDVLDKMCRKLASARIRLRELVENAAIDGLRFEKAFKNGMKVDMSTPMGQVKAFDAELQKMCASLETYFETIGTKLRDLNSIIGEGQSIAGNIKVNEENARSLENMKQLNAELQEQIQRQTEEIERQRQQWQQLADAVRSGNVQAVQNLSQQTDEATKRLSMDVAKNSLKDIKSEMDIIANKMADAQGDMERYGALVDEAWKKMDEGDTSVTMANINELEDCFNKAKKKLEECKAEYNGLSNAQKKYIDELNQVNGHQDRMRTQIMNTRDDLMRLIVAGQTGTPQFQQLAEHAANLRRQMQFANATMQYFANPSRHIEGLKTALQGATGAASVITGVIGVFNKNSEEMAAIQTKIQSYMGILVGLETAYATVKKTSNAMLLISEVQSWAEAKAKIAATAATEAGTIATIKATAAQAAFNIVAKANPYVLLATAILSVVGGIALLIKSHNKEEEVEERLKKTKEDLRREQKQLSDEYNKSLAETRMSYIRLQAQWNTLSSEHERAEWVKKNKDEFEKLGLKVEDVKDAEGVLVANTGNIVQSMLLRAKAAYMAQQATAAYNRALNGRIDENTRTVNADQAHWMMTKGYGVTKTGDDKYFADAEGIRAYNAAIESIAEKAFKDAQYGIIDLEKEADVLLGKYKAVKEEVKKDPKSPKQEQLKSAQELSDEMLAIQKARVDAELKNEKEYTDKWIALMHMRIALETEMAKRRAQQDGDAAVSDLDKAFKGGKSGMTESEYKSRRENIIRETQAQIAALNANMEKQQKDILDKRDKNEEDAANQRLQSMREYLKKYGNELQQELAITEEYQEKIKAARKDGDEGKAMMLEKQMQEAISNSKLSNLKNSPEYIRAFEDLNNTSSETLKILIKRFEDAKEAAAKSLEPHQLKEYSDSLQRMYDELESRNPFDTLVKSLKELADAQAGVKSAQAIYDDVKAGKIVINTETGNAYTEEEASRRLADAKDREAKVYTTLTKASIKCADTMKSFASTLNRLGEMVGGNLGSSIGAFGGILDSLGDAYGSIKNFNVNATGLEKAVGQFSAVAGTVSAMIDMNMKLDSILPDQQSLYEHYAAKQREINEQRRKMIELEIEQLEERLNLESWFYENGLTQLSKNAKLNAEYAKAYGEIAAAPQEIYKEASSGFSKWAPAIIGAIVGIIAGVVTFGAGAGAGAALGAAIGSAIGGTAIGAALGSTVIALIGTAIFSGVGAALGNAVRAGIDGITYDEGQTKAINNLRVQTRHKTFFRSEQTQDLQSWVRENWGQELFEEVKGVSLIDPEVAKKLLEDGPTLVGETRETLEKLLEYSEKIHEFLDQVHEYVSEAFSPLVDNLTDALWDWLTEGKDVLNSFREYAADTFKKIAQDAMKAMITKKIFEPFQEQLENLTIAYSTGQIDETGYMAGVAQQAQDAIEAQLPVLQNAAGVMKVAMESAGIHIADSGLYQQEASKNGYAVMSQDTGEELNGRFTALQIAGENISAQMNAVAPIIVGIGNNTVDIKDMVDGIGRVADDMLTNIVECYTELNLIRTTTDEMLPIMKENKKTLEKIEKNTKNI